MLGKRQEFYLRGIVSYHKHTKPTMCFVIISIKIKDEVNIELNVNANKAFNVCLIYVHILPVCVEFYVENLKFRFCLLKVT